jgi:hypothetical protein
MREAAGVILFVLVLALVALAFGRPLERGEPPGAAEEAP